MPSIDDARLVCAETPPCSTLLTDPLRALSERQHRPAHLCEAVARAATSRWFRQYAPEAPDPDDWPRAQPRYADYDWRAPVGPKPRVPTDTRKLLFALRLPLGD